MKGFTLLPSLVPVRCRGHFRAPTLTVFRPRDVYSPKICPKFYSLWAREIKNRPKIFPNICINKEKGEIE